MDRVGGYLDFVALREDERAYDDIMLVLAAESDARRIQARDQKRQSYGEPADLQPVATWTNEPVMAEAG